MKPKSKSWGGFEKFKPAKKPALLGFDATADNYRSLTKMKTVFKYAKIDAALTLARHKLLSGAKLTQREVCALAREASRGNDVVRKEARK